MAETDFLLIALIISLVVFFVFAGGLAWFVFLKPYLDSRSARRRYAGRSYREYRQPPETLPRQGVEVGGNAMAQHNDNTLRSRKGQPKPPTWGGTPDAAIETRTLSGDIPPPGQDSGAGGGPASASIIVRGQDLSKNLPFKHASLKVIQGNQSGQTYQINRVDYAIGRADENNMQILDLAVSRQHARLRYARGAWYIQDQGSTTGTYINGQRVTAGRLKPGDKLTFGVTTFVFQAN